MRNIIFTESIENHCRTRITPLPSTFSLDVSRYNDMEDGSEIHTIAITFMYYDMDIMKCEYVLNEYEEDIIDSYESLHKDDLICDQIRNFILNDILCFINRSGHADDYENSKDYLCLDLDKKFDEWSVFIQKEIERMGRILKDMPKEIHKSPFNQE